MHAAHAGQSVHTTTQAPISSPNTRINEAPYDKTMERRVVEGNIVRPAANTQSTVTSESTPNTGTDDIQAIRKSGQEPRYIEARITRVKTLSDAERQLLAEKHPLSKSPSPESRESWQALLKNTTLRLVELQFYHHKQNTLTHLALTTGDLVVVSSRSDGQLQLMPITENVTENVLIQHKRPNVENALKRFANNLRLSTPLQHSLVRNDKPVSNTSNHAAVKTHQAITQPAATNLWSRNTSMTAGSQLSKLYSQIAQHASTERHRPLPQEPLTSHLLREMKTTLPHARPISQVFDFAQNLVHAAKTMQQPLDTLLPRSITTHIEQLLKTGPDITPHSSGKRGVSATTEQLTAHLRSFLPTKTPQILQTPSDLKPPSNISSRPDHLMQKEPVIKTTSTAFANTLRDLETEVKIALNHLNTLVPFNAQGHDVVSSAKVTALEGLMQILFKPNARGEFQLRDIQKHILGKLLSEIKGAQANLHLLHIQSLRQSSSGRLFEPHVSTFHHHVDLPIKYGDEFGVVNIHIQQRHQENKEREEQNIPNSQEQNLLQIQWRVLLTFDFKQHGSLSADIRLIDDKVTTTFWAQNHALQHTVTRQLYHLRDRLTASGLDVDTLDCMPGIPAKNECSISQALIDTAI